MTNEDRHGYLRDEFGQFASRFDNSDGGRQARSRRFRKGVNRGRQLFKDNPYLQYLKDEGFADWHYNSEGEVFLEIRGFTHPLS